MRCTKRTEGLGPCAPQNRRPWDGTASPCPAGPDRHPGRPGPQPEKYRPGYSAAQDRGHCGSIRLRQILAGAGHFVRRRLPAVSGVTFHLHTPPDDPGRKGAGGPGALCPGGTGTAAASGCAGDPQHLWHRHGAIEQPAADVLPPGKPPLPQRALPAAQSGCGGRYGAGMPCLRRPFFCSGRRGTGV